jgi:hypothetical protein
MMIFFTMNSSCSDKIGSNPFCQAYPDDIPRYPFGDGSLHMSKRLYRRCVFAWSNHWFVNKHRFKKASNRCFKSLQIYIIGPGQCQAWLLPSVVRRTHPLARS